MQGKLCQFSALSCLVAILCAFPIWQFAVLQQINPVLSSTSTGLIPLDADYASLRGARSCQGLLDCASNACDMFYLPNVVYVALWPVGAEMPCSSSFSRSVAQEYQTSMLFAAQTWGIGSVFALALFTVLFRKCVHPLLRIGVVAIQYAASMFLIVSATVFSTQLQGRETNVLGCILTAVLFTAQSVVLWIS